MSGCKRERWRKEWVRGAGCPREGSAGGVGAAAPDMDAALAADVSLTLLHALELVTQVHTTNN